MPTPLDRPPEAAPVLTPTTAIQGAAAEARAPGATVLRGEAASIPSVFPANVFASGDTAIRQGGASGLLKGTDTPQMPKAFQDLNAEYGKDVRKPAAEELWKPGSAEPTINVIDDASKADVVLKPGQKPIVNVNLSEGALKQLNVKIEAGVTEQEQQAFKDAIKSHSGGVEPKVTTNAEILFPHKPNNNKDGLEPETGGDLTPNKPDGGTPQPKPPHNGGDGKVPPAPAPDGNELNPPNGGKDPNDLTPEGGKKPNPTVSDGRFSKELSDLIPKAVGDVFRGGTNMHMSAYGNFLSSVMSPELMSEYLSLPPEKRAEWLRNHKDIADKLKEKAKDAKNPEDAKALNDFAENFAKADDKFANGLAQFGKNAKDGKLDASDVKALIPQGVQNAIARQGVEAGVKELTGTTDLTTLKDPQKIREVLDTVVSKLQTNADFVKRVYARKADTDSSSRSESDRKGPTPRLVLP